MRKSLIGLLLAFGALAVTPAHADSDWRVKAGMLSVEDDDSAATNVGLVYAMDFLGMIGAEFEANTTVADGEISGLDYNATQLGGYATVTTPGPIYFKAKAGYVYTDAEVAGFSDNDTDIAYGVGAGFFGLELEYTRTTYEDLDVDFISVAFGF